MSLESTIKNKNVAVVGNATSLFYQKHGAFIDSHDIVIRFNKASPVMCHNVEKTHGSKFDFWMFWTIGAFYNRYITTNDVTEKAKELFYSNYPIKIQASINGHKKLTEEYIDDTCPSNIFKNLRDKLRKHNTLLQPSAGIVLLSWLENCSPSSVNIFGMDFKKTSTFSEPERFETEMKNGLDTRCNHDYNLEKTYFHENLKEKMNIH